MLKLDIRQESSRHSDVLDTVTQYLGLGSYKYALPPTLIADTLGQQLPGNGAAAMLYMLFLNIQDMHRTATPWLSSRLCIMTKHLQQFKCIKP